MKVNAPLDITAHMQIIEAAISFMKVNETASSRHTVKILEWYLLRGESLETISGWEDISVERLTWLINSVLQRYKSLAEHCNYFAMKAELEQLRAKAALYDSLVSSIHAMEAEKAELESEYERVSVGAYNFDDLSLNVRAQNMLNYAGILSLPQLLRCTEYDILMFRNGGPRTLTHIQEALGKFGLALSS